jgi:hypothetical protein
MNSATGKSNGKGDSPMKKVLMSAAIGGLIVGSLGPGVGPPFAFDVR